MSFHGRGGLAKNNEEAMRWYRLAADQGYAAAKHNLALMKKRRGNPPCTTWKAVVRQGSITGWYSLYAPQGHKHGEITGQKIKMFAVQTP